MTKREFAILKRRIVRSYRLQLSEYDQWMDEAATRCSDAQWDEVSDVLAEQNNNPLTDREVALRDNYSHEEDIRKAAIQLQNAQKRVRELGNKF